MFINGLGSKPLSEFEKELAALSHEDLLVRFKALHKQAIEWHEELLKLRKKDSDNGWLDAKGNPTYQNGA